MRQELFRQEVIDHQRDRLLGEIILTQSIPRVIWISGIVIVAVLVVLLLVFGSYTRKERVQGYVVPSGGIIEVYPQGTGTIAETFVEAGDLVAAGDALLKITNDRAVDRGEKISISLLKSLQEQRSMLESQIVRLGEQKKSRKQFLEERIKQSLAQIRQVEIQLQTQEEHLQILSDRFLLMADLKKNKYISDDEYQRRHELLLVEKNNYEQLKLALIQTKVTLNENTHDLNLLDNDNQAQVDEIESRIESIDQRVLQQKGEDGFIITAPTSGRVASLQVYSGQRVLPDKPVMAVLPENVVMEVELFIPARAAGFVKDHMRVEIRYESFPYERFGVYMGEIQSVSKTILTPEQITAPLPIREPVYRSRVKLVREKIKAYDQEYPLQAGMTLEASVLLDKRPLYQWLFKPLYSVGRAF